MSSHLLQADCYTEIESRSVLSDQTYQTTLGGPSHVHATNYFTLQVSNGKLDQIRKMGGGDAGVPASKVIIQKFDFFLSNRYRIILFLKRELLECQIDIIGFNFRVK